MRSSGLLVALWCLCLQLVASQSLSITSLLVENKVEPLGIDVSPRFSWILTSAGWNISQISYQLRVSSTGGASIWDSGLVSSNLPYTRPYEGPALQSDTKYLWNVSVIASVGSATASSTFTTGFLTQADWNGSSWIGNGLPPSPPPRPTFDGATWIWTSDTQTNPPNAPAGPRAFRKTFVTPTGKKAVSATVLLTADDAFTLYANGASVGSSPATVDTWKSGQIFTINTLNSNSNLFAIGASNTGDAAGVLATIQITFDDGTNSTIHSDSSWRSNINIPSGFELPSTDDTTSGWANATVIGTYGISPWGTGVSVSDSLAEHPAPLLRKKFSIGSPITNARLYYAAGGFASIRINGAPASDHVLSPGFTNYDVQAQYVVLDVKSLLVSGDNAIAVELGRGHYGMTNPNVWNWQNAPWHAEPALKLIFSLEFADGSKQRIVSDPLWKMTDGPTRLDDLWGGENYDAKHAVPGYDTATFNDGSWRSAKIVVGPKGLLVNQRQPPTRITQSLSPTSISEPTKGTFVVAFPRVIAGWAQITVTGPANTRITVNYGEKLQADGTVVYQQPSQYFVNNFQTDRFFLAGTGSPETFEPKFSYKGFQYVQLSGWPESSPPKASDILARVVHGDLKPHGGFTSSSDILNKLHQASVYTMLNNVQSGVVTDCPQYEKNGWSGDAMVSTDMFLYNLDAQETLSKYVRDLDESRAGGSGPPSVIAPDSGGWGLDNFKPAPTWNAAFITIPWWLYQYRGERRLLEERYNSMQDYVEFELARANNNIASSSLGDWVTPETSPDGGNPPENITVPATAYLYHMIDTMANIATILGKTDDASRFKAQAISVKNSFNAAFFNPSLGHYAASGDSGYRQTHNLLALAFGLIPNTSLTQGVADSIAADVASRGTHLNTGALGTKYILPVLSAHGHADVALALATQTTYPSWGFWIANGATTMWEHWAIAARSRDHHFLGTFEDWLYQYAAGIQTTGPAFQKVTIAPAVTGGLQSVSVWTTTPFGNLTVAWTNDASGFHLTTGIPVGVEANIVVPATSAVNVQEGGKSLANAVGILNIVSSQNTVSVSVGSGVYSFTIAK
ncbi:bacterial alpha-L-rhamnosidase-domain-containing protein [Crepidotus variabilis]|uniref:alpha-L-rhamnosidase n=1 Tax=Crepidotus variabilis TaxID=179855 RepID=A0A9P6ELH6_9AGAR|nr:bacterial alpha-L-rhamnosidase-domain-containing protein [Crepidotus variabilis]